VALLKHFEKRVSQALSYNRSVPVVFAIPRRSSTYRRELVAAERLLFNAEGDFDLAIEAVNLLFDDRRYNWKTWDSLLGMERSFLAALAIARANRQAKSQQRQREKELVDKLFQGEDIFK